RLWTPKKILRCAQDDRVLLPTYIASISSICMIVLKFNARGDYSRYNPQPSTLNPQPSTLNPQPSYLVTGAQPPLPGIMPYALRRWSRNTRGWAGPRPC